MRLLDMEDMLLAAERGEVSESRVGPLYAALCALPSCARGFLSGDVIVRVTWALGAVASQVMRGLNIKEGGGGSAGRSCENSSNNRAEGNYLRVCLYLSGPGPFFCINIF